MLSQKREDPIEKIGNSQSKRNIENAKQDGKALKKGKNLLFTDPSVPHPIENTSIVF